MIVSAACVVPRARVAPRGVPRGAPRRASPSSREETVSARPLQMEPTCRIPRAASRDARRATVRAASRGDVAAPSASISASSHDGTAHRDDPTATHSASRPPRGFEAPAFAIPRAARRRRARRGRRRGQPAREPLRARARGRDRRGRGRAARRLRRAGAVFRRPPADRRVARRGGGVTRGREHRARRRGVGDGVSVQEEHALRGVHHQQATATRVAVRARRDGNSDRRGIGVRVGRRRARRDQLPRRARRRRGGGEVPGRPEGARGESAGVGRG